MIKRFEGSPTGFYKDHLEKLPWPHMAEPKAVYGLGLGSWDCRYQKRLRLLHLKQ